MGFTVTGCQPNRYYRARAMHLVEWGDEAEAKVTQIYDSFVESILSGLKEIRKWKD